MLQGSAIGRIPIWVVQRIEDEAVEYYRSVGCLTPAEEREPVTVDIVQRDDLAADGDPDQLERNPAQVRMTGMRLSPDEARELARLLNRAAGLATTRVQPERPRQFRGWNGGYGLAPAKPRSYRMPERRSA